MLVTATPQYVISSCDDKYNITRITPFESKNIHSFVLGEPALADPLDADLPDEVHIFLITNDKKYIFLNIKLKNFRYHICYLFKVV